MGQGNNSETAETLQGPQGYHGKTKVNHKTNAIRSWNAYKETQARKQCDITMKPRGRQRDHSGLRGTIIDKAGPRRKMQIGHHKGATSFGGALLDASRFLNAIRDAEFFFTS